MGMIRWGNSKLPEDRVVAQAPAAEVPEGAAETVLAGTLLVPAGAEGETLLEGTGTLLKLLEGLGAGALPEGAGALLVGAGALPEGAGALLDGTGALLEGAGAPLDGAGATLEGAGAPGTLVGGQLQAVTVTVDTTVIGVPGRGAELAGVDWTGETEATGVEDATAEDDPTALAPAPEQVLAFNWTLLHIVTAELLVV